VCWTCALEDIGDEAIIRIVEGLEMNASLKELCLERVFLPLLFDVRMNITFMSLIWNEWMIECGIGFEGAKRIGEMLERNASLMKLYLEGASPLIHSFMTKCGSFGMRLSVRC
jgi:hypothetical protein